MTKGIYCYYDNWNHAIIYIGKDSYIDENTRHRQHYQPSRRDKQHINQVLQNDNKSGRYSYHILEQGDFTDDELNQKEISWIAFFKPKHNHTEGGDGFSSGENHPMYGKKLSKETRKKISENSAKYWKDKKLSKEHRKKISENNARYWKGKKRSKEHREKMSFAHKGKKLSKETCEKISRAQSGKNNPNAKYQNAFWDINNVKYAKSDMFKNENSDGLNPRRCFCLKYKGNRLNIGYFHEWLSIEIISQKINEYQ